MNANPGFSSVEEMPEEIYPVRTSQHPDSTAEY